MKIDRRRVLQGGLAIAAAACNKSREAPAPPPPGGAWRLASFDPSADAPEGERAMILAPWPASGGPDPAARPLLVALHGRGESGRGLDVGAGGWPNDYLLDRMHRRLLAPPLTSADLLEMTNPERLAKLNASLAAAPYQGLGVACPYTPNLRDKSVEGARAFARFVMESLLPKLRAETGSRADRSATGIDGVSMGGRLALLVGLSHPEVFGVVGTLQPAISVEEAPMISALAQAAMSKAKVALRLVTSEKDYFLEAVKTASERMRADGVPHELLVIPGTHGYDFNRGPGGAEMMLWHERVQRGLPPP
ncbi:MAG: alpha/beta hydrolase-fold protein [Minicystis sp.]